MKLYALLAVVVVAAGYVVVDWSRVYKQKTAMEERVEARLPSILSESEDAVREALAQEAKELGIVVKASDIRVAQEDTQVLTPAQQAMAETTRFTNKKVQVELRYTARLAGVRTRQHILATSIQQVSAQMYGGGMDRVQRALEATRRVPDAPLPPTEQARAAVRCSPPPRRRFRGRWRARRGGPGRGPPGGGRGAMSLDPVE